MPRTAFVSHPLITFLPHQRRALDDLTHYFRELGKTRGQYISACGTGKTAVMLAMPEVLDARISVIVERNINLIEQVWRAAERQHGPAGTGFDGVVICSDPSVTRGSRSNRKTWHTSGLTSVPDPDATEDDHAVEVTPNELRARLHGAVLMAPADIADHIDTLMSMPADRPIIIFCTYASLHQLKAALDLTRAGMVDLAMFDEAHNLTSERVAILGSDTPDAKAYHPRVGGKLLFAKKMIFATATPKLSSTKGAFGMDDTRIFGEVAHRYTYAQAVREGAVAPFDMLVLSGLDNDDEREAFYRDTAAVLRRKSQSVSSIDAVMGTQPGLRILAAARMVSALRRGGQVNRALMCSSSVKGATLTAKAINALDPASAAVVHSGLSTTTRRSRLNDWHHGELPVIAHCQMLGEGHDVPSLDAAVLVDPKSSFVELNQLVGRVTRFQRDPATGAVLDPEKRGLLVLPVIGFEHDQHEKLVRRNSGPSAVDGNTVAALNEGLSGFDAAQAVLAAMDMPGIAMCELAGNPPNIDAAEHNRFVFPRAASSSAVPARTRNNSRRSRAVRDFTGMTQAQLDARFGPNPAPANPDEDAWLNALPRVLSAGALDPDPAALRLHHGPAVAAMVEYLEIKKVDKARISDADPDMVPVEILDQLCRQALSEPTAVLMRTLKALRSPVLRGAYADLLAQQPLGSARRLRDGDLIVGLPVPDPALGPRAAGPVTWACAHALVYSAVSVHAELPTTADNRRLLAQAVAFFDQHQYEGWPQEWVRFLARIAGWPA